METMNVPGAFDGKGSQSGNGNGNVEKQEMTRTAVEGQHHQHQQHEQQHQHQQQQQQQYAHQTPNTQQQIRPQPTTNTSTQQFRGGRDMMNPTDQLRQRYSRVYEGEVQSSPPRRTDDDHDHMEFVSGHDLSQRLHREQQQQQRKGRV